MMLPFAPEYRDEMRLEEGFVTLLPPQGMMELAGMDGKTEDPDERVDRSKAHSTQSKGALE